MIYLLRHTKPNIDEGICYGHSDLELFPHSVEDDLSKAIESIASLKITKIYTSPLKRCRVLAEAISRSRNMPQPIVDDRLMETNFGDWEMCRWDSIFESELGRAWFDNFLEVATPNGESFLDLQERSRSFFDSIGDQKNILVVTHDGFIRATLINQGILNKNEAFAERYPYGVLKIIEKSYE